MLLEQDAPPRPAETADPAFRADVLRGFAEQTKSLRGNHDIMAYSPL